MDADAFLAWTRGHDDETRFELIRGEIAPIDAESDFHAIATSDVARQLLAQFPRGDRRRVFIDRKDVRIGDATVFQPDVVVDCTGHPLERGPLAAPALGSSSPRRRLFGATSRRKRRFTWSSRASSLF